jgi:hypothetical protein
MKGRKILLSVVLLVVNTIILAYPKVNLDWHTPERHVSTIGISLGGLNHIYAEDYAVAYDNPALLTMRQKSYVTGSFRSSRMEEENIASLVNPNYLLHDKQFTYFSFSTSKFAISYQPAININNSIESDTLNSYHNLYMNSYVISLAAADEQYKNLKLGLNLKLIDGRQVYHEEKKVDNHWEDVEFVDDSVTGYSIDAAVSYVRDSMIYGVTIYDILSQLYWSGRDNDHLRKRYSAGMGYHVDNSTFTIATQGRFNQPDEQTYHMGWGYSYGISSSYDQTVGFKTGMYSHDFDKMDNIFYTFGMGYTISMFTVNFSGISKGFTLNNTDYLFSVTVGM